MGIIEYKQPTKEELVEYHKVCKEVENSFVLGRDCNMCGKLLTNSDRKKCPETNCCAKCVRSAF